MNPIVPYIFFVYIFIATWIIMMNYDNIKMASSSKTISIAYVSIAIATVVFVGVATLYNIESKDEDYKEKIKYIRPQVGIF